MMQFRVAAAKRSFTSTITGAALRRELATFPTGRVADPAVHSGDPDDTDAEGAARYEAAKQQQEQQQKCTKENDPIFVPSKSPLISSPKLENTEVPQQPQHPMTQHQKRNNSTTTITPQQPQHPMTQHQKRNNSTTTITLEDVSCVGLDGTPLMGDDNEQDRQTSREEQEMDDKEFYKHHKASPLSEIELADTRKPITRATDGTADYADGDRVVTFSPEQIDTAEDSLRRATEIWKQSAMNGDPDLPHSRVLRALRGEF